MPKFVDLSWNIWSFKEWFKVWLQGFLILWLRGVADKRDRIWGQKNADLPITQLKENAFS